MQNKINSFQNGAIFCTGEIYKINDIPLRKEHSRIKLFLKVRHNDKGDFFLPMLNSPSTCIPSKWIKKGYGEYIYEIKPTPSNRLVNSSTWINCASKTIFINPEFCNTLEYIGILDNSDLKQIKNLTANALWDGVDFDTPEVDFVVKQNKPEKSRRR